jgi:hypothetical protein
VALGTPNQTHINFRDSKLTRILQPSLSGNARMAVICCATPSELYLEETRSTLQFASRAKLVKTRAQVNEVMDDRSIIRRLQRELALAKLHGGGASAGQQQEHFKALEQQAANSGAAAQEAETKLRRLQASILNSEGMFGSGSADAAKDDAAAKPRKRRLSDGALGLSSTTPMKGGTVGSTSSPKTVPRAAKRGKMETTKTISAPAELALLRDAMMAKKDMVNSWRKRASEISRLVQVKESELVTVNCSNDILKWERDAAKEKLASSIATLREEMEATSTAHEAALRGKEKSIEESLAKLEQELEDRKVLEETVDALQEEKVAAQRQLDAKLEQELEDRKVLEETVDALQEEKVAAQRQLDQERETTARLVSEKGILQEEKKSLQETVQTVGSERNSLLETTKNLGTERERISTEKEDLNAKLESLQAERVRSALELAQTNGGKENLVKEREEDKGRLQDRNGKIEFITSTMHERQEEKDLEEVKSLGQKLEKSQQELQAKSVALEDAVKGTDKLNESVTVLNEQVDDTSLEPEEWEEKYESQVTTKQTIQANLPTAKAEIDAMKHEQSERQNEISKLNCQVGTQENLSSQAVSGPVPLDATLANETARIRPEDDGTGAGNNDRSETLSSLPSSQAAAAPLSSLPSSQAAAAAPIPASPTNQPFDEPPCLPSDQAATEALCLKEEEAGEAEFLRLKEEEDAPGVSSSSSWLIHCLVLFTVWGLGLAIELGLGLAKAVIAAAFLNKEEPHAHPVDLDDTKGYGIAEKAKMMDSPKKAEPFEHEEHADVAVTEEGLGVKDKVTEMQSPKAVAEDSNEEKSRLFGAAPDPATADDDEVTSDEQLPVEQPQATKRGPSSPSTSPPTHPPPSSPPTSPPASPPTNGPTSPLTSARTLIPVLTKTSNRKRESIVDDQMPCFTSYHVWFKRDTKKDTSGWGCAYIPNSVGVKDVPNCNFSPFMVSSIKDGALFVTCLLESMTVFDGVPTDIVQSHKISKGEACRVNGPLVLLKSPTHELFIYMTYSSDEKIIFLPCKGLDIPCAQQQEQILFADNETIFSANFEEQIVAGLGDVANRDDTGPALRNCAKSLKNQFANYHVGKHGQSSIVVIQDMADLKSLLGERITNSQTAVHAYGDKAFAARMQNGKYSRPQFSAFVPRLSLLTLLHPAVSF